jgi:hypothetical protein
MAEVYAGVDQVFHRNCHAGAPFCETGVVRPRSLGEGPGAVLQWGPVGHSESDNLPVWVWRVKRIAADV